MAGSRRPKTPKSPEEFWQSVLSGPKVKRILEQRGFNPDAFRKDYEADNSRAPRRVKPPSRAEIDAVEAFQQSGDFEQLKRQLSTRSAAVANAALRRVVQYKARGGVKTIRRRTTAPPP
jgi:hypothetical protein